jgi:MFS family permease
MRHQRDLVRPAGLAGGPAPAGGLAGRQARAAPLDRGAVAVLSTSHLVGDINQGVVGPLVAPFVTEYRYSYAAAGSLILGTSVVSTVAQPVLGHLADRIRSAWLLLIPLGLGLYAPHSVMVAMGQELVPNHLGVASGLLLGLAVSTGGLAAPLLGRVGDAYGISWAFGLLAATVLTAALLASTLPRLRLRLRLGAAA